MDASYPQPDGVTRSLSVVETPITRLHESNPRQPQAALRSFLQRPFAPTPCACRRILLPADEGSDIDDFREEATTLEVSGYHFGEVAGRRGASSDDARCPFWTERVVLCQSTPDARKKHGRGDGRVMDEEVTMRAAPPEEDAPGAGRDQEKGAGCPFWKEKVASC